MIKKNKKIIFISSALFIGLLTTILGAYFFYTIDKRVDFETPYVTSTPSLLPMVLSKPDTVETRILSFGDVFWGRRVQNWSEANDLGFAYPFSGLNTFEKENYNAWIANLECPVTNATATEYEQESLLKFNCKPEFLEEAKKWFDVFSLANNHMDNMEEVGGLEQTRSYLESFGIQYFGHYDNSQVDAICEIMAIDAVGTFSDEESDLKINQNVKIPFALCGYHNVFAIPTQIEIDVISNYSKYLPTIVMPHMGIEYETKSDGLKQQIYRKYVDAGADLVLGGHPHSVQETEVYNGKLIVYSLGNFIFDQQGDKLVTQGIGLESLFRFEYDENLEGVINIAESCVKFQDDCIIQMETNGLNKPKYVVQYDIVATDSSNKLAKKGSETDLQEMLVRTNWAETLEKLKE